MLYEYSENIQQAEPDGPTVAESLSVRDSTDRSWFIDFLFSIFDSPDLDYSQFVELERKKSRHELERNSWY